MGHQGDPIWLSCRQRLCLAPLGVDGERIFRHRPGGISFAATLRHYARRIAGRCRAEPRRLGNGSAQTLPREAAARQGPELATLTDLINMGNPINWIGSFGGATAHKNRRQLLDLAMLDEHGVLQ